MGFVGCVGVGRFGRDRGSICRLEKDDGKLNFGEDELREERERQANADYRRKVEERLRGTSSIGAVDLESKGEVDYLSGIPDDLDELDDIAMNRGPNDQGKVAMWGAWLDESVAGRKVGKTTQQAEAEEIFRVGLDLFERGRYKEATKELTAACLLAGVNSREGGQYQLWLGQALDAAGEKKKAIACLQTLKSHRDSDVRKVADEVLFIITAPPLNLGKENFVSIETGKSYEVLQKNGRRRSSIPTAVIPKGPEKYSLEWFLEKKPEAAPDDNLDKAAVAAVVLVSIGLVIASRL
uniref:Uncharacterized protein n=1 Tax=Rhodosorus marinus TaxID=101924 RepID=A0A7S2ZV28_9RHOD|mmetsp:Transcript_33729/g.132632  ORF Transcript_33729/g.132632 Transcript_33729/m.132632 type:complete len:295 (+) Transcript_33729:770-1654(+)|eukprot:CAMPEP_0113960936 /NCGR_PEP_ID=MMETSP0011_2-20120614/5013_1 /TAXON_ID=101924 /ORGANISM="Rhodosorus marinus" /LENGTH=294 /DNA_ID=CAMNT_0000972487 /DNA_START=114 /DNA_END=998 /DNA_ORIENTATION=- /assembly_acc=CAM_ASM_000156